MFRGIVSLVPILVGIVLMSSSNIIGFADAAETVQKTPLIWHYYKVHNTCDSAEVFVRHQVKLAWKNDKSITAKLVRLLYSDCLVTGCDASILLAGPDSERTAPQNAGLSGFDLIDDIRTVLDDYCPGVVSCADILNFATRDALHLAGAPAYPVLAGRKDGFTSSASSVDLPSPSISWESALSYFQSKGLDVLDLGTLLGAHSLGKTHCSYILDRLYNFNNTGKPDPSMSTSFLNQMRKSCPQKASNNGLVYLDPDSGSKYTFSNSYYKRILSQKAVLEVDQQLLFGNDTSQIVEEFAAGFEDFRKSFALSMSRMGSIGVLTGKAGEIRKNCQYKN